MHESSEVRSHLRTVNMSTVLTAALILLFSVLPGSRFQLLLLPILLCAGAMLSLARLQVMISDNVDQIAAVAALAVVVAAAAHQIPNSSYPGLWSGFGMVSAASALALATSVTYGPRLDNLSLRAEKLTVLLFCFLIPITLVAPRLLLFIQPPNGLINLGDTTYHVLDELLAPYTGGLPYGDYTPQYTGVLGWLILPLRLLPLNAEAIMTATIAICGLLNLAVPVLVVAISRIAFPSLRRVAVFCAFVALWTVCGTDLGYSSQVREFSHFARYVPSLFAVWLVLIAVSKPSHGRHQLQLMAAGCGLAMSVLNSADHGLTLTMAVFAALVLGAYRSQVPWGILVRVWSWFLLAIASYIAISLLMGQQVSVQSYLGLRSDALAGTVYGADKQISPLGPQILVLMTPVMLIAIAFKKTPPWRSHGESAAIELLAVSTALWSLLLTVKFIMKDPAGAVELPSTFVPIFIGGVVVFYSVIVPALRSRDASFRILTLPMLFTLSLVVGSVYPSSNVSARDEVERISGRYLNTNNWSSTPGRSVDGWSIEALVVEENLLNEVANRANNYRKGGQSLGYFGAFGNTVELVTGVNNVTGIAAPESLRFGTGQETLACKPAHRDRPEVVIVFNSRFPCSGYSADFSSDEESFQIYRRLP